MKYKNLFIVLWLVIIWTLFFSIFQYFVWGIYSSEIITLQFISWYMWIWWIVAYIIWWAIYEILKQKKYHFFTITFLIWVMFLLYFIWNSNVYFLWIMSLCAWFFYWLWMILRNILVADEIKKWILSDTKINAFVNILFTSWIVLGSILWWFLSDFLGEKWVFIIIFLLFFWWIIWLLLWEDKQNLIIHKQIFSKKEQFFIWYEFSKKYFMSMVIPALIITFVTILFQKVIEYNVSEMWISLYNSTFLLLYWAFWWVIWNIFTIKLKGDRWKIFSIITFIFWITLVLFPIFMSNFFYTKLFIFFSWILFWINFNLSESYFLKELSKEKYKSFWASIYWFLTNVVMSLSMFLILFLSILFQYSFIFIGIWILFFIISFVVVFRFDRDEI